MQKYSVASNMLQLSNISMTKYVMIIKYFFFALVGSKRYSIHKKFKALTADFTALELQKKKPLALMCAG